MSDMTTSRAAGKADPSARTDTRAFGDPPLPGIVAPDSGLAAKLDAARRAKGDGYRARTRHLRDDGSPVYTNRLIFETSPYLLQHAHNPVNWYAWGDEPFARAARENKPVLLSIGYSTCHWCHVMEHESFEDLEIAQFINEHFVAVKVDREERPDVDDVYMTAVQMMTGRGGWPMTLVLTPERKPFFGGTYFPARDGDRGARVGFLTILGRLSQVYMEDRENAVAHAEEVSRRIRDANALGRSPGLPSPDLLRRAAEQLAQSFDSVWGGFGSAPKFPRPATYDMLLRYHRRSGDARALAMTVLSLKKMAAGGIYDHVAGGFHRYSTDRTWLVPHFEKMVYDNAQLAAVYLDAFQVTGDADFARVATETLDYLAREMTAPGGGLYSATDADSKTPTGESEEGWYFTWTPHELLDVLDASSARAVEAYYAVEERGNFEGRSILHTPRPIGEVATTLGIAPEALRETVDAARVRLREARARRSPPLRDDKIVAAWNGLAMSAFARGAFVLGRRDYAAAAERAADFVLAEMRSEPDGELLRVYKDGRAQHRAVLDDYAFVIQGLLDTYEATSERAKLDAALELQAFLDRHFLDADGGGYFSTGDDHETLLVRSRPYYDGAEPSGNSVAILNLLRLEEFTDAAGYRERAEAALRAFGAALVASPTAAPKMLAAVDSLSDEPLEIVIVLPRARRDDAESLLAPLGRTYLPNRVVCVIEESAVSEQAKAMPLLEGKRTIDGRPTAYVCRKRTCKRPTTDPLELERQLREARSPESGM